MRRQVVGAAQQAGDVKRLQLLAAEHQAATGGAAALPRQQTHLLQAQNVGQEGAGAILADHQHGLGAQQLLQDGQAAGRSRGEGGGGGDLVMAMAVEEAS